MNPNEHYAQAEAAFREDPIRCAVITVSDTRTEASDRTGSLIRKRLHNAGHEIALYEIVPDRPALIEEAVQKLAGRIDVVLLNGGTGISRHDRPYDALSQTLEKPIPGFGELFRMLFYEEAGAAAMRSRAVAGVYQDTLFFAMPGSLKAAKLALDELIIPGLPPLVWNVVRNKEEA